MDHPQKGEWYWGAKCPHCGELTAHTHDPSRGKGDTKPKSQGPGQAQTQLRCSKGHLFDAKTENLLRFEWGAQ